MISKQQRARMINIMTWEIIPAMLTDNIHPATALYLSLSFPASESSGTSGKIRDSSIVDNVTAEATKTPKHSTCSGYYMVQLCMYIYRVMHVLTTQLHTLATYVHVQPCSYTGNHEYIVNRKRLLNMHVKVETGSNDPNDLGHL